MTSALESPPAEFSFTACAEEWFHWLDIQKCFWPGAGKRSALINPVLGPIGKLGGVYLLAWSKQAPERMHPAASEVRYIGETYWFKDRMDGFRRSAGLLGERTNGHSAAWRWPLGQCENLWVAFFEIPHLPLPDYLCKGWRKYMEAIAIHEHVIANSRQPLVTAAKTEVRF